VSTLRERIAEIVNHHDRGSAPEAIEAIEALIREAVNDALEAAAVEIDEACEDMGAYDDYPDGLRHAARIIRDRKEEDQ
jgi:hypothetical protein